MYKQSSNDIFHPHPSIPILYPSFSHHPYNHSPKYFSVYLMKQLILHVCTKQLILHVCTNTNIRLMKSRNEVVKYTGGVGNIVLITGIYIHCPLLAVHLIASTSYETTNQMLVLSLLPQTLAICHTAMCVTCQLCVL